jgi:hypothetical protein
VVTFEIQRHFYGRRALFLETESQSTFDKDFYSLVTHREGRALTRQRMVTLPQGFGYIVGFPI